MSKYNRKQRKTTEDEFISFWARLFRQAEPYARAIGITIGSALLVYLVVWGILGWIERRAEASAELFGRAVRIYDADLLVEGAPPPPKTDEENPVPHFKTAPERADATLKALDDLDKQYSGHDVARDAQVFRAGVLYDLGKFDEAEAAYRKYLEKAKKDAPTAVLATEGIGLCAEAKGKLDEALTAYQSLEPKKGDFFRDRALFNQARIYKKKGDKKRAAELYNQILTKMPQSPLKDEIQTQMSTLENP